MSQFSTTSPQTGESLSATIARVRAARKITPQNSESAQNSEVAEPISDTIARVRAQRTGHPESDSGHPKGVPGVVPPGMPGMAPTIPVPQAPAPRQLPGVMGDIASGFGHGINDLQTQAGGAMQLAGQYLPGGVGQAVNRAGIETQQMAQDDPFGRAYQPPQSLAGRVARGVPGVGAFVAASAAGGLPAAMALGGAQAGGGTFAGIREQQLAQGATEQQAADVATGPAVGSAALGAVLALPQFQILGRFMPGGSKAVQQAAQGTIAKMMQSATGRFVLSAAEAGGINAVQHIADQTLEAIGQAQPVDSGVLKGAGEAAMTGALLAPVGHVVGRAFGGRENAVRDAQLAEAEGVRPGTSQPPARDAAPGNGLRPAEAVAPVDRGADAPGDAGVSGVVPPPLDLSTASDAEVLAALRELEANTPVEASPIPDATQSPAPDARATPEPVAGQVPEAAPEVPHVAASPNPTADALTANLRFLSQHAEATGRDPARYITGEDAPAAESIAEPTTPAQWRSEARRLGLSDKGTLKAVKERIQQANQQKTTPTTTPSGLASVASLPERTAELPPTRTQQPVPASDSSPTVPAPAKGREAWYHKAPIDAIPSIEENGFAASVSGELGPGVYVTNDAKLLGGKFASKDYGTVAMSLRGPLLEINRDRLNQPHAIMEALYGRAEADKKYDDLNDSGQLFDDRGQPNWKLLRKMAEDAGYVGIDRVYKGSHSAVVFDPTSVVVTKDTAPSLAAGVRGGEVKPAGRTNEPSSSAPGAASSATPASANETTQPEARQKTTPARGSGRRGRAQTSTETPTLPASKGRAAPESGQAATASNSVSSTYPKSTQGGGDASTSGGVIRDPNGNPLTLYHGTSSEFEKFKPGQWDAVYFTDDKANAENFAKLDAKRRYEGTPRVVEANIRLPKDGTERFRELGKRMNTKDVFAQLRKEGYDGIHIPNDMTVVFDPENILPVGKPTPNPTQGGGERVQTVPARPASAERTQSTRTRTPDSGRGVLAPEQQQGPSTSSTSRSFPDAESLGEPSASWNENSKPFGLSVDRAVNVWRNGIPRGGMTREDVANEIKRGAPDVFYATVRTEFKKGLETSVKRINDVAALAGYSVDSPVQRVEKGHTFDGSYVIRLRRSDPLNMTFQGGKMVWQMTPSEYAEVARPQIGRMRRSIGMGGKDLPRVVSSAIREHREIVQKALDAGKHVPENVLAAHGDTVKSAPTPNPQASNPRRRGAAINPIEETLDLIKRQGVRAAASRTRDLAKIEQRGADAAKTEAEKLQKAKESAELTVKAYAQQLKDTAGRARAIKGIEERGATVANRRLFRTELELEDARMAVDDMKAKLKATIEQNKKSADLKQIMQAKVTEMAKDYLPPDLQGKMLVQVRDAKNAGDVFQSLFKIEGLLLDRAQKNTVRMFQAVSGKSMLGKLTEERRTQAKDIIATAHADVDALKAEGATPDARRAAMESLLEKTNRVRQIYHDHKYENKLRIKGEWVDRQATLRRLSAAITLQNAKPRTRDAKDPTKLNDSYGTRLEAAARHAVTPESLFMRIDGDFKTGDVATDTAYWQVNKAQEKYDADARNYMAALDGLARSFGFDGYADVAARTSGTLGDATQQRGKVRIDNGEPVAEGEHTTVRKGGADTLSVGQIADLYLASMDSETAALMQKGQQWRYKDAPDTFDVSPSDVSALAKGVDRRILDFYEKANAMLNMHAPEMMHQQWLVKGYESPIPQNHWTRHRDKSALPVRDQTGPTQEADGYLENWGGLTARKQNTSVPLIVGDVHRNLMDKMDMTFRIKNLMVPLWTARRVMQDKSILDAIESRYGKQANTDIDNYFKRNGGLDGRDDSMIDRLAAKYSGAVTKLNPKSWAKQPASYATMLIDLTPAEWAKGVGSMFSPSVHREMVAHSDMAANRAGADPASLYAGLNTAKPGRSSGRLAAMAGVRSIREAAGAAMKADLRGVAGNIDDAMSKATPAAADRVSAANWMDGAPLRALWTTVKARHGGNITPEMIDEFERIGSRYMNSGRETQQSFLASGMKARGAGVFTAFSTDLQKMRSNLYRAAHMDNRAKARAVAGVAMSIAYTAAINYGWKSAVNAASGAFSKKDDQDEDRALYDSLVDGVAGIVPTGNAVTGFVRAGVRGWKDPLFNAPVYSGIESVARDAVMVGTRIYKRLNGNAKATDKAWGDLYDLLSDYAKLRGVPTTPVDTLERIIEKRAR